MVGLTVSQLHSSVTNPDSKSYQTPLSSPHTAWNGPDPTRWKRKSCDPDMVYFVDTWYHNYTTIQLHRAPVSVRPHKQTLVPHLKSGDSLLIRKHK